MSTRGHKTSGRIQRNAVSPSWCDLSPQIEPPKPQAAQHGLEKWLLFFGAAQ